MSRIPQPFIDDLINRVDIVDIVDKRVKLKKTGKNYSACCPFHNEKTPSFTVSQDKQFYYCFGCGATGNVIGFVMDFDKVSFVDSVEMLASNAGMQVPKEDPKKSGGRPKQDFKSLYALLDQCANYFSKHLKEHPDHQKAIKYLKERGLSGQIAKDFKLGYAPKGWDNLLTKLGTNTDDRKALITTGMVIEHEEGDKRYDRFRQRIMFPILDIRGRTIGFGGRVLGEENRVGPDGKKIKGSGPKYLNSPETPVFHKGKELYGLYQARQAHQELNSLLVVEGYMDVIALAQYGIRNAVATLGTACGEEHLKLAFKYTSTVVFCFDGDKAGRTAAKRALENSLPVMVDGYQIKFLFLPEGQDPDTLIRQIGHERFNELIKRGTPLEEFFFSALSEGLDIQTMSGKARLSKLAAPLLHKLPKSVYRELMFELLAQRTGLNQDILQELISEPAPKLAPELKAEQHSEQPEHYSSKSASNPSAAPEPSYLQTDLSARFAPESPFAADATFTGDANPTTQRNGSQNEFTLNQPTPNERARNLQQGPIDLAIALLLENPALAHVIELPELLDSEEAQEFEQIFTYLKARETPSLVNIIGAWGGRFGTQAQNLLIERVNNQLLRLAKRSKGYDDRQELIDAFAKITLQTQALKRQTEIDKLKIKPPNQLSSKERARLIELLTTISTTS